MAYLFCTMSSTEIIGSLITFSPWPHLEGQDSWGIRTGVVLEIMGHVLCILQVHRKVAGRSCDVMVRTTAWQQEVGYKLLFAVSPQARSCPSCL